MANVPSRAVMLFGTEERVPPAKTLRAGPLTVELENGNLRYIRYAGLEALRAVAFLVRDRNWATYCPTIENLKIGQGPDSFRVSYDATCADESQRLRYRATIIGQRDGTLEFAAEVVAETAFVANRIGFVVLHPLEGVAGEPVRVTHTDGSVEDARFPRLISPGQPFFDIRALAHEVVPGVRATCTMEGDAYEMEDHRNWTDASFKTYIRPLAKPRPFSVGAGERLAQRVTLSFEGRPSRPGAAGAGALELTVGEPAGTMPRLGLWLPPHDAQAALEATDLLRRLGPGFLIAQLDLRDRASADALRHAQALAQALNVPVTLEVVLPNRAPPEEKLREAAALAGEAGLRPEAVVASPHEYLKSWQPNERWPEVPPLETIYDAARVAFPDSRIGGGMLSYFTELNRKRPPMTHCDFISHTTCPIVHDADDRSVIETLEALPWVAESVRAMADGKPYRIGPSMIGMRQNPYGAAPVQNPENRRLAMAWNDPRQRALFGAAWNLGYAARMAAAGVEALALSAPLGAFGVIHAPAAFPQPWYDQRGGVYPLYHVLRGVAAGAGKPRLAIEFADGARVQAIGYRADARTVVLWIANLTAERQQVQVAGLAASEAQVSRLDATTFEAAADGPDGLATGTTTEGLERLELGAYGVLRLEVAGSLVARN